MNKVSDSLGTEIAENRDGQNFKTRRAPVTVYTGGYEYALIWILQYP